MKIQLATIRPVRQRGTCFRSCTSALNRIYARATLHARHKTAPKFERELSMETAVNVNRRSPSAPRHVGSGCEYFDRMAHTKFQFTVLSSENDYFGQVLRHRSSGLRWIRVAGVSYCCPRAYIHASCIVREYRLSARYDERSCFNCCVVIYIVPFTFKENEIRVELA